MDPVSSSQGDREQMGRNGKAVIRADRQQHKKPLELEHEEKNWGVVENIKE